MTRSASNRRPQIANDTQSGSYCRVAPPIESAEDPRLRRVFCHPKIFHNGIGYSSLSEAAFAVLLELFVPGFRVFEGQTYQVPLPGGASADFLLNGVLIEYHEPRIRPDRGKHGDFPTVLDYRIFKRALKQCGRNHFRRQTLLKLTRERLSEHYRQKRRRLVASDPTLSGAELIIAGSRDEFYELVICRFCPAPPPKEEFFQLFWLWVDIIARANSR